MGWKFETISTLPTEDVSLDSTLYQVRVYYIRLTNLYGGISKNIVAQVCD